jgi:biopolymer transport protein ExbD
MHNNPFDKEDLQSPLAEINITPLVDVMLVLLVILLITTPIINNSLNLDLATAKGSNTQQKALDIIITNDNKFLIDKEEVGEIEMRTKLQNIAKNNPNQLINLKVEKNVEFVIVAKLLSIIQQLQFNNVSFITKQN